jgi:hypothetical protein
VRALPRRERRIVAVITGVLGIAAIAAIVVVVASGSKSMRGCVDLTFASSTGGSSVHLCGRKAADWCRFEATRSDPLSAAARTPCARAGYR